MKKKKFAVIIAILINILIVFGCYALVKKEASFEHNKSKIIEQKVKNVIAVEEQEETMEPEEKKIISTIEIVLKDIDGDGKNYSFDYQGEQFSAIYTTDNWHIVDSYKIEQREDIMVICQALINIHPIHGKDGVSYRTAEDMTFEWLQHNLAYQMLPEDNRWKESAKHVDLDPKDQYRTLKEIYEDRTGKKFDIKVPSILLEKNDGI